MDLMQERTTSKPGCTNLSAELPSKQPVAAGDV